MLKLARSYSSLVRVPERNALTLLKTKESSLIPFPMIKRTKLTHDTYIFRYGLPEEDMTLGLPVGGHVIIKYSHSDLQLKNQWKAHCSQIHACFTNRWERLLRYAYQNIQANWTIPTRRSDDPTSWRERNRRCDSGGRPDWQIFLLRARNIQN